MICWINFVSFTKRIMAKIKANLREGYTVENHSRGMMWLTDEPEEIGGNNLGPAPTEVLLSSLASCKLITLRMYAARKEWDLQNASIELEIVGKEDKTIIRKSLLLEGNLDEKQVERLRTISGRCPVVKMLADSIEFIWND